MTFDLSSPLPENLRSYQLGSGPTGGQQSARPAVIVANKTSDGVAVADKITEPVTSEAEAIRQVGARSEALNGYLRWREIDPDGPVSFGVMAEATGTKATRVLTIANDSSAGTNITIKGLGEQTVKIAIGVGDDEQDSAEALAAGWNAVNQGRMPISAAAAAGTGDNWDVTFSFSQNGDRGAQALGTLRIEVETLSGTQAQTYTLGAVTAGTGSDDNSLILAELSQVEFSYHVTAKTASVAPTATDNGLGEHMAQLKLEVQPEGAKDQRLFYGLVGTPAQANAVASASTMNSAFGVGFHMEDVPWTPLALACHYTALIRREEVAHPVGLNVDGAVSSDTLPIRTPVPYEKSSYPSRIELISMINNGVSPIAVDGRGRPKLVRHITNRCLNDQGSYDYRVRSGHIPNIVFYFWDQYEQQYAVERQPMASDEPSDDVAPPENTTTPSAVESIGTLLIRRMVSNSPPGVSTPGPVLEPAQLQKMLSSVNVTYDGAGKFLPKVDIRAAQKNISLYLSINEVSPAY